jgi:hypothetical protein
MLKALDAAFRALVDAVPVPDGPYRDVMVYLVSCTSDASTYTHVEADILYCLCGSTNMTSQPMKATLMYVHKSIQQAPRPPTRTHTPCPSLQLMTATVHEVTYWFWNTVFFVASLVPSMRKYKIQPHAKDVTGSQVLVRRPPPPPVRTGPLWRLARSYRLTPLFSSHSLPPTTSFAGRAGPRVPQQAAGGGPNVGGAVSSLEALRWRPPHAPAQ